MDHYEIVIAGAGPAGSITALILARGGRRVLLLDKGRFPRPKACGDCLNPRLWPFWRRHGLDAAFSALEHGRVRELEIAVDGKPCYRREVSGDFRAVDRARLDAWLLGEARRAGAEVREEKVVRKIDSEGRIEMTGGAVRADFVLGTDGRNSIVAQQAGLLRRGRRCRRIGWQVLLSGLPPSDRVRMNVFAGGYSGLVALDPEGRRTDLAMVLEAGLDPKQVVQRFFPEARIEEMRSIAPIARPQALPARGSIWLAGDAARVVEPFTGEGIFFALASGEAAAETLRDGWGKPANLLAERYRRRHQALYAGELRVNGLTRWLLTDSGRGRNALLLLRRWPRLLDALAKGVLPPE